MYSLIQGPQKKRVESVGYQLLIYITLAIFLWLIFFFFMFHVFVSTTVA